VVDLTDLYRVGPVDGFLLLDLADNAVEPDDALLLLPIRVHPLSSFPFALSLARRRARVVFDAHDSLERIVEQP
jgi:hypothetical protein